MKRRVVAILMMAFMALSVAGPAQAGPCLPKAVNDTIANIVGDGWPPCVNP